LVPSRYNFSVAVADGSLLYNVNSGALVRLSGEDGKRLGDSLAGRETFALPAIPTDVTTCLADGGFLVPPNCDEVAVVRERFRTARDETPAVLTIATTQDCNLGCYYCYEERSVDRLQSSDVASIVAFARNVLAKSGKRSLHVDWYGGEPLLNIEFLESASLALQELCREQSISYHASVISNGTLWPAHVGEFIRKHAIRQVQISFRRHARKP
jgi:uncharacterized protein